MKITRIPTGQLFGTSPLNEIVPQSTFPVISPRLEAVLREIAATVVERLGCVGAMVATLEHGNALPVRAYSLRFADSILKQLERQAGVTLIGPDAAVFLDDEEYAGNISCRAVRSGKYVISDQLYDLLCPMVERPLASIAQRMTGIRYIIAVPFSINEQIVGNLFAATRHAFTERDIDFLMAFGQQAANAIQSQRHLDEMQALERVVLALQSSINDETQILQMIVDAVVYKLGYVGGWVSTIEETGVMPIRAYAFTVSNETRERVVQALRLDDDAAKPYVLLEDPAYEQNLGYQAVNAAEGFPIRFVESDTVYDLLRPHFSAAESRSIQDLLNINAVIAVPFFLENEVIGSLFVLSQGTYFTEHQKASLTAFAQQAAVGIRNARLYRRQQTQRQIAQTFGRMAFTASASVHTLRNNIGAFRNFLMLVPHISELSSERQERVEEIRERIVRLAEKSTQILDNLHEPWRQTADEPNDVNSCLNLALLKLFPNMSAESEQTATAQGGKVRIRLDLSDALPPVFTSPDMLTEAFRIVLKNGVEAIAELEVEGLLWLSSMLLPDGAIEVSIRDNGVGIAPQDLPKVFEMGYSTKPEGMGFGLFWVKDYIEGLGGEVTVRSSEWHGTTFRIVIPSGPPGKADEG